MKPRILARTLSSALILCFIVSISGCSTVSQDDAACEKYMSWYHNFEQDPPPTAEEEEPGELKLLGAWQLKVASHYSETANHLDTLRRESKSIEIRRAANAASDYWKMQSENMYPFANALSEGSYELAKTLAGSMRPLDKGVMAKHIDAIDTVCADYYSKPRA